VRVVRHQVTGTGYVSPHYLSYKSSLTQHIIAGDGHLKSFGMDLAATARQHHKTVLEAIPFYALIVLMTAFQYLQQRQMNQRNPQAANANPHAVEVGAAEVLVQRLQPVVPGQPAALSAAAVPTAAVRLVEEEHFVA